MLTATKKCTCAGHDHRYQEHLQNEVHSIWSRVILETWQEIVGSAEDPVVHLHVLRRSAEQVGYPPAEELESEPDGVEDKAKPHQGPDSFEECEAEQYRRESEEKIEEPFPKRCGLCASGLVIPSAERNPSAELKVDSEA